jgi:hypothetical protein
MAIHSFQLMHIRQKLDLLVTILAPGSSVVLELRQLAVLESQSAFEKYTWWWFVMCLVSFSRATAMLEAYEAAFLARMFRLGSLLAEITPFLRHSNEYIKTQVTAVVEIPLFWCNFEKGRVRHNDTGSWEYADWLSATQLQGMLAGLIIQQTLIITDFCRHVVNIHCVWGPFNQTHKFTLYLAIGVLHADQKLAVPVKPNTDIPVLT